VISIIGLPGLLPILIKQSGATAEELFNGDILVTLRRLSF